ncbi:MAG: stage V sporulation protein B [Clostridiaceae bacterium]
MKDNFLKNSFFLTLSNLTTGFLMFIFIIILSKELGPEGMGLYAIIMPIYDLFICLICGGMVIAISSSTAIYLSKKDYPNLNKLIKTSLFFDLFWGLFIAILVFIASPFIAKYILKDSRALKSIMIICPAMLFVALSSILKGYFYGIKKIATPAIIDICEKAIRVIIILSLLYSLKYVEIKNTVFSAYLALTIGEAISFLLLYINYKKSKKIYFQRGTSESSLQILFNTLRISYPLCLNGFLTTILAATSSILMPRRLIIAGYTYQTSLALIGKFKSMSLNITNFPIIIIISVSIVLIPDLSKTIANKDYYLVQKRIKEVLFLAFFIGIISSIFCFIFSNNLGFLFYKRNDLGNFIRFTSITSPFTFLSVTTYAILNGVGKQKLVLKHSLITSVIELILIYFLTAIPKINVYSYGYTIIITSCISIFINFKALYKNKILTHSFNKTIWNKRYYS